MGREETADEDCGSWRCFGGKDSILLQKVLVKGICPLIVWRAMTFIFECPKDVVGWAEMADEDCGSGRWEQNSPVKNDRVNRKHSKFCL